METKRMTFDGTEILIDDKKVVITENSVSLDLHFEFLTDGLILDAQWRVDGMVRANSITRWEADRLVFCASLAQTRIAKDSMKA